MFSGFGSAIYEVNEFSIRLGSDIAAETKLRTKQPPGTRVGVDCMGGVGHSFYLWSVLGLVSNYSLVRGLLPSVHVLSSDC
jgi:hypothetical protein